METNKNLEYHENQAKNQQKALLAKCIDLIIQGRMRSKKLWNTYYAIEDLHHEAKKEYYNDETFLPKLSESNIKQACIRMLAARFSNPIPSFSTHNSGLVFLEMHNLYTRNKMPKNAARCFKKAKRLIEKIPKRPRSSSPLISSIQHNEEYSGELPDHFMQAYQNRDPIPVSPTVVFER